MTQFRALACRAVALGVFLSVLAMLAIVVILPRATGGATLNVLTGSMQPAIDPGSVVVVRPVDPLTLHPGDVITFAADGQPGVFITHRIVEVLPTSPVTFVTKGDANSGKDPKPVPAEAVRGQVWFDVPLLGRLRQAAGLGSKAVPLAVGALGLYALAQVVAARRESAPNTDAAVHSTGASHRPADLLTADGLNLQLLVATLRTRHFGGLTPALIARLLRMDLVDEGSETFTLALAREPEQLDTLIELLMPFAPVHLVRSSLVSVPVCHRPSAATMLAQPIQGEHRVAA